MSVKTYNAKDVLVIVGTKQLSGFGDEDIVSIKPNGEGFQTYVGADGDVGRSTDPDETAEITITLATTSASNDYLSTLYNLDRKTGKGMVPIAIKDLSGSTLCTASQAWIVNFPEVKKGKSISANEWVFHTGQANFFVGGND